MNLFVVGDVHGCYYTWRNLLRHWRPAQEILVQAGDLIDRGNYSAATVASAMQLHARHPETTAFLKGNHEAGFVAHLGPEGPYPAWLEWGGRLTLQDYLRLPPAEQHAHLDWLTQRPLYWENEHLFISHAGVANTAAPLIESNPDGVLWRRGPLRNIGRRQIVGHTPTSDGQPRFDDAANALYLDTGAYQGHGLTGVRLSPAGEVLEVINSPTHPADIC